VFAQNEDGSVRVVDLPEPSTAEVERLVVQIATAVEKRVAKEKPSSDEFEDDEDAVMTQARIESMHTHLPSEPPSAKPKPNPRPRCAFVEGYSLDANVSAGHDDRPALERLLRYGARPAFSHKRLELTKSGKVAYKLRRPSHTGQTHVVLEPLAFLKRLATLIPPPRQNLITYRGCFAPNARLRRAVVELCPAGEDEEQKALPAGEPTAGLEPEAVIENNPPHRRSSWAQLLKRVFHNDLLVCNKCNGKRKIIAFVTEREPIQQILTHLGLPNEPPTIASARAPPQTEMFDDDWDQGRVATDAP